jgi:hypothetical protein
MIESLDPDEGVPRRRRVPASPGKRSSRATIDSKPQRLLYAQIPYPLGRGAVSRTLIIAYYRPYAKACGFESEARENCDFLHKCGFQQIVPRVKV